MLELRKVNVEDWDFILKIRNEEKYRMYFYEQKKISKEEHYEYLKKMSTNSNFFNWIICYDSKDVGYIRILNEDISIMMDLEFNGKGLGTKALKLVENKARENGMRTLREDGWDKVVKGVTTVEEILRVTLSDRN